MIYLYDPINNIKTPSDYELIKGMTGYAKSTLMYCKSKRKKLSNINCYIVDGKITKKELRSLMEMEAPKDEMWRLAPGLLGRYEISSYGRLRNEETKYLMTPVQNSMKVLGVTININDTKVWFAIHRLVAEAFLYKPEGCDSVIHKGSRYNNHVDNLKWTTRIESLRHNCRYSKTNKPIYKLDMDTYEIVDDYDGIRQASRENFIGAYAIRVAAKDITKVSAGFRWCLIDKYEELMKHIG